MSGLLFKGPNWAHSPVHTVRPDCPEASLSGSCAVLTPLPAPGTSLDAHPALDQPGPSAQSQPYLIWLPQYDEALMEETSLSSVRTWLTCEQAVGGERVRKGN